MVVLAIVASRVDGREWPQLHEARARSAQRGSAAPPCTTDGAIHAEVSSAITAHAAAAIRIAEPGARMRDAAKLTLPCGFRLDPRSGWQLVLTNGREVRAYRENNAFGFAPAFGFGETVARSYVLRGQAIAESEVADEQCMAWLKAVRSDIQRCSGFGSNAAFFGTSAANRDTRLAHYRVQGSTLEADFPVATIAGHVDSLFFLALPDAAGGTITVVVSDGQGTYRAFLDTPKG